MNDNNTTLLTQKKRNDSIDATRGIALFLVVLSHSRLSLPYYLIAFYVMAFFFISGYLYKPGKSYTENIKKKASRLLVPYFANSLILLIIYSLIYKFSAKEIIEAIQGIIYSRNYIVYTGIEKPILGTIANNPLWYLTAFFTTSLLFHAVVDYYTKKWGNLCYLCLILLSFSIGLTHLPILLPLSFDIVPFCTIVMILGYIFKKESFNLNSNGVVTFILFISYIALCLNHNPINLSIREYGGGQMNALLIGILGSLTCISLTNKCIFRPFKKIFTIIGKNSIVILSYHLMFIRILRMIIIKIFLVFNYNIDNSLCEILIVCISIFCCITMGYIYEKVKNVTLKFI